MKKHLDEVSMRVMLFNCQYDFMYEIFEITLLSILIGESERSLFSYFRNYHKTFIDLFFIHIKL
jgi:hypothetical protein